MTIFTMFVFFAFCLSGSGLAIGIVKQDKLLLILSGVVAIATGAILVFH